MTDRSLTETIHIRRAVPSDSRLLSDLGKTAYRQHFTYLWTNQGLEQFFDLLYTPAYFEEILRDDSVVIWVAETAGRAIGYLIYYCNKKLPDWNETGGYINRIYLLRGYNGQGIGSRLMDCAVERAGRDGVSYLWLESMQSSEASIRFYQKHGFEICGATAFTQVPMRTRELAKMWYMYRKL